MSEPAEPGSWLGMIWAQDAEGGIGRGGELPWHLPADLAHFRATTSGAPVIMGRLQWESLPERFRPLPGRRNIVLSRDPAHAAAGAETVGSLADALAAVAGQRAWIVGGGQIYRLAMDHADELVVTEIDGTFDADVFAPAIGPEWRLVERAPATGWAQDAGGLAYAITRYARLPGQRRPSATSEPGHRSRVPGAPTPS